MLSKAIVNVRKSEGKEVSGKLTHKPSSEDVFVFDGLKDAPDSLNTVPTLVFLRNNKPAGKHTEKVKTSADGKLYNSFRQDVDGEDVASAVSQTFGIALPETNIADRKESGKRGGKRGGSKSKSKSEERSTGAIPEMSANGAN